MYLFNNVNVVCSSTSTDPDAPNDSIQSYSWNFGDQSSLANTSTVTHNFSKGGNKNISLTVTDSFGGTNTVTKSIAVRDNFPPVASLSCSTNSLLAACNALASYDPEGQAITFKFEYSDSFVETNTNGISTHAYPLAGLYTVKLTVTDSLGASTLATTQVQAVKPPNQLPTIKLNCNSSRPNYLVCNGLGSTDSDGSIVSYQYSFDDGASETKADGNSVTHQFSQSGDHSVVLTVIDNDGGVSTLTNTFSVLKNITPITNFSCTNTAVRTIRCTSSSSDSDGVIASTTWTLDDGSSFSGVSFEHAFLDDLAHVINLQVTDDLGASTSTSSTLQPIKNQPPKAELYASTISGVAPLAINFEARSAVDVDGSIASIEWTFSDGTTASGANVSHTFSSVGSFSATLKVTDNLGAVTTKSTSITSLEPLRESPGLSFKYFEDSSTQIVLISNLTKTQFDLDHAFYTIDGSQTIPITEFYPGTRTLVDLKNYGIHTITLTVFDVREQSASATYQVNLLQDPATLKAVVDFKVTQSSVRTALFNFNRTFNPDILFGIRNFRIDYGDGTFANTATNFATHTYLNAGSYTATLTVTTNQGTVSSLSKIVTVSDQDIPILNPVAAFGYQINSWARNVSFYNDRSGTPNGNIISYLWDFGDGSTGTGDKVAHFYEPGDYLVTLTVTDSAGLRNSQTQHVTIYQDGSDLVANIDCGTATTQTQNCSITALDKFNEITSVRVLWGDGTSSTLTNPVTPGQGLYRVSKKYFTSGVQTIGLYVYTSRGEVGTATITKNIILPNPVANIFCYTNNLLAGCNALASYDPKGGPLTYTFNYQDGFTETNATGISSHAYLAAGTYNVSVTVKDNTGLSSVATTSVQVVVPQNVLPVAQLNCITNRPLTISCNAGPSYDPDGFITSAHYEFDDGFTANYDKDFFFEHVFLNGGSHSIKLTVVDNVGGLSSITKNFDVKENSAPIASINCYSFAVNSVHCNSNSYDTDLNDSIIVFKWDLGDGVIETTLIPSIDHTYINSISRNITLQVKDSYGATSIASQAIAPIENLAPVANFICLDNGPLKLLCQNFSYDPESMMMATEWFVDGQAITVNDNLIFNLDFSVAGVKTITQKLTDAYGLVTIKDLSFTVKEDMAPSVNIICNITNGSTYQCSSNATDIDGQIIEAKWTIEGKTFNGQDTIYNFTSGGDKNITFSARDNFGNVTVANTFVHVDKVEVSFTCLETSPFHISCNYLKNDNETKEIVAMRYYVDDRNVYEGESFEHVFLNSGEHKINLTLYAADLSSAYLEKIIVVEGAHLPPKASFTSFADIGYKLKLDSSDSFKQGRKVINFKWNFGDGTEENIAIGEVFHTFQTSGNYDVVLTVSDDQGDVDSITKSIYVYDPEVPDPGDANSDTIAGVDLDDDGIRDDVQRWINFEVKDNLVVKNLLRQLAKIYQLQVVNSSDSIQVRNLEINKEKVSTCFLGQVNNDELVKYYQGMFQYLYTSTEIRSKSWSMVQGNLVGYSSMLPSGDEATRLLSCEDH